MRRIEIDDRLRDLGAARRIRSLVPQRVLQGAQQAVMHGPPLGQQPDAKRGIDIVESVEQRVRQKRSVEEKCGGALRFGLANDGAEVDVDAGALQADAELVSEEALVPELAKRRAKLAQRLPKRAARFLLLRFAP